MEQFDMPLIPQQMKPVGRKTVHFNYWLYLPPGYAQQPGQKWPLVLFLHGRGERGSDLELVKKHGLLKLIAAGQDFPFILIAPQCPLSSVWPGEIDTLNLLLEDTTRELEVDLERIYLTGLSMGGFGSWWLACKYPNWFAAAVPICGGGEVERAYRMKAIPTWVFHGGLDDRVPLSESEKMVNALKEAGGNVRFTVYPQAKHDSWSAAYADPGLYVWLLSQKKGK